MSVSFPAPLFFPATPAAAGAAVPPLTADLEEVSAHCRTILDAAFAPSHAGGVMPLDDTMTVDVSLLYGPQHSGKSRLLMQLAYRIASESASPSASSSASAVVGDPFQPVMLLLPRRRNLEQLPASAASGSAKGKGSPPLLGLFGAQMSAPVLQKIKIKWYDNDAHLLSILCELHLLSAGTGNAPSSSVSVPPRFVGVLYDRMLSTDAAHLAIVMARLTEAVAAINISDKPFAKCQALFCMSHVTSVGRLKTLLPRYARCVFEVTPVPGSSEWLLQTRPMLCPSLMPMSTLNKALTPLSQLLTAEPIKGALLDVPLALTRMPGLPILRYSIGPDVVECTGIYV